MNRRRLVRIAAVAGALGLFGFVVAASGLIPIKASSGHWRITEWFLRFSMKRSIATHRLGTEVPPKLRSEYLIQIGATHYELACRSCHGRPQGPRPRVAAHMLPMPPDLAPRVRESSPARLYEVVKHGLKFTGMPAWPAQNRDDEIWAVVAFLLKYPELDAGQYHRLAGGDEVARPRPAVAPAQETPGLVQSCARCHGTDGLGRGNALLPHLAGQRPEYLQGALRAYAADRRRSGIMGPVAVEVPPAAITAIANHFASLPPARAEVAGLDHDAVKRGAAIAREGVRAQRVPACLECHGPTGHRTKPEYPLLAGQPASYLELQLALFRENHRGGADHAHIMQQIAARLTPTQARDAAQFFASLPREQSGANRNSLPPER